MGYSDTINLEVSIKNLKEPAYYTSLGLTIDGTSGGDVIPQESSCAFQNTSLHCVLGTIDEGVNVSLN